MCDMSAQANKTELGGECQGAKSVCGKQSCVLFLFLLLMKLFWRLHFYLGADLAMQTEELVSLSDGSI